MGKGRITLSRLFEDFIATSKYCRWLEEEKRRETWEECVNRYFNYFINRFDLDAEDPDLQDAKKHLLNREVFPSMRALMTAGAAAEVDDTCLYNCSYVAVNDPSIFSQILYILCCGTGVGFSCERDEIAKLPEIPNVIKRVETIEIIVKDSRKGWAESLEQLVWYLYQGIHPTWDTVQVRPAGARLKTFGGRASGPEPLIRLFKFVTNTFHNAKGRKLSSLEVHDIVCMIGEIVIAGAVRRSALISLSDLEDKSMARAKSGPWWESAGHRSLANNSAVYNNKPSFSTFLEEWAEMYNSKSGERGICNRESMKTIAKLAGRDSDYKFGTNPCSEIILRHKQFCNLSEIVIKSDDTIQSITSKIRSATIFGTIQSACTRFPYLDEQWRLNCDEERLLGVSFTGIYDNKFFSDVNNPDLPNTLIDLKKCAKHINKIWSNKLGINESTAITCVKPSGTTSCVAGSSSGMHPRYSKQYIRRVRMDKNDPMTQFMSDQGIPHEDCCMRPHSTTVFSFPISSPLSSKTQKDISALNHLNLWLIYQRHWCDHKPSVTISYSNEEFLEIGNWVWNNWDWVSGISFLPKEDHVYDQAPFEEIKDYKSFLEMEDNLPIDIDWTQLKNYEKEDTTTNSKELACSAGGCEITDLTGDMK